MKRDINGEVLQSEEQRMTPTICLLEWGTQYLNYAVRYSPKTYSEKRGVMKRCIAAFGPDVLVGALKPGMALTYLQRQFQERSGHAANKERKNLIAAWNHGVRFIEGFPPTNPFLAVPKFPEESHRRYMPSVDDFWKVVGVSQGQDRVLLLTFLHTAARRGEVYRLQWSDVDFDRQRIRLTTRKRRDGSLEADWIPMGDELCNGLLAHRQSANNEWVFTQMEGRRKGKPYLEYRGFPQELCLQAGVTPFGCHAIRHLTASILGEHDTPMVQIKDMLRHRKLATTELYVRSLQPLRPHLRVLEGGLFSERSTEGFTTNEKGLRVVTS
jgi:integrase